MLTTKAARRYASALLQIAKERSEVEEVLHDIQLIKNTMDGSRELILFLRSPIVKFDDKAEALDKIFGDKIREITQKFIGLITRKNRVNLLNQICEAFIEQYNEYAGIIEIDVYTAFELSEAQKENLHESLEEKTDQKVNMSIKRDQSLLGGIAVRIQDTVIDGTVKHKLEELEERLLSSAFE